MPTTADTKSAPVTTTAAAAAIQKRYEEYLAWARGIKGDESKPAITEDHEKSKNINKELWDCILGKDWLKASAIVSAYSDSDFYLKTIINFFVSDRLKPLNDGEQDNLYKTALTVKDGKCLTMILAYSLNITTKLAPQYPDDFEQVLGLISSVTKGRTSPFALEVYLSAYNNKLPNAKTRSQFLANVVKFMDRDTLNNDNSTEISAAFRLLIRSLEYVVTKDNNLKIVFTNEDIIAARELLLNENELHALAYLTTAAMGNKKFTPVVNNGLDIEVLSRLAHAFNPGFPRAAPATAAADSKAAVAVVLPTTDEVAKIRVALTLHIKTMVLNIAKLNEVNRDLVYSAVKAIVTANEDGMFDKNNDELIKALCTLDIFQDPKRIEELLNVTANKHRKYILTQHLRTIPAGNNAYVVWLVKQNNWEVLATIKGNINFATLETVVNLMLVNYAKNNPYNQTSALELLCSICKEDKGKFAELLEEVIAAGKLILARTMLIYGAHLLTPKQAKDLIEKFSKPQTAVLPATAAAGTYDQKDFKADAKVDAKFVESVSFSYEDVVECDKYYSGKDEKSLGEDKIKCVRQFESALLDTLITSTQNLTALRTRVLDFDGLALLQKRRPPSSLSQFFGATESRGFDTYKGKSVSDTWRKVVTKAQERAELLVKAEIESLTAAIDNHQVSDNLLMRVMELKLTAVTLSLDKRTTADVAVKKFIPQLKAIRQNVILPILAKTIAAKYYMWAHNGVNMLANSYFVGKYNAAAENLKKAENSTAILAEIQVFMNVANGADEAVKIAFKPLKEYCQKLINDLNVPQYSSVNTDRPANSSDARYSISGETEPDYPDMPDDQSGYRIS